MKSQRLLEILLRLQARSPRSARELAGLLEVAERTIYRDVDALSAAGVPIFTIRGARGGIGLVEGYRQALSQLAEEEIRSLFIGGADPLVDLGFEERLAPAREKLYGALNDPQRAQAVKSNERIRIEPNAWGRNTQPVETLALLRMAIWDDRVIRVEYRNQDGAISRRTLHPLGLVFKAGVWYAVARERERIRTFRAERLLAIDVTSERFVRPEGFRLDRYWEASSRLYESKAVACTVRVSGKIGDLEQLGVFWPIRLHPGSRASARIADVTFPLRGLAVHEMLAWCGMLKVLEPADIVQEIVARLKSAHGLYGLVARAPNRVRQGQARG